MSTFNWSTSLFTSCRIGRKQLNWLEHNFKHSCSFTFLWVWHMCLEDECSLHALILFYPMSLLCNIIQSIMTNRTEWLIYRLTVEFLRAVSIKTTFCHIQPPSASQKGMQHNAGIHLSNLCGFIAKEIMIVILTPVRNSNLKYLCSTNILNISHKME